MRKAAICRADNICTFIARIGSPFRVRLTANKRRTGTFRMAKSVFIASRIIAGICGLAFGLTRGAVGSMAIAKAFGG